MPSIGIVSGIRRVISDAFTRTTSGSLGSASGGNQRAWSTATGTWYANGSAAQSDTAASSYATSYQLLYPNATISADVSGGVGISFNANAASPTFYYASYPNYIQNSSTNSTCTGSTVQCQDTTNTCTPSGGCGTVSSNGGVTTCTGGNSTCTDTVAGCKPTNWCGTLVSSSTNTTNCSVGYYQASGSSGAGCYSAPSGGSYITSAYTTYSNTYNTNLTTYTRTSSSTVTSTTYTYDTQIKTITSAAGSVVATSTSSLVSGAGSLNTVGSLKVVTSGTTATITAYSSTGLVSQLGSPITFTPGGTFTGPYVGIIKAPSTYSQGSTLDNFSATA